MANSKTKLLLGVAALVMTWIAATIPIAQSLWMSEAALRQTFAGATIVGQYVDGRTFQESYAAGGTLEYDELRRSHRWKGRWSIVRGRFCTIYDNFGTGGCFRVRQISLNCFEFFFDTRTEKEARQSTLRQPTWTARAWRIDQLSTCQERPMV